MFGNTRFRKLSWDSFSIIMSIPWLFKSLELSYTRYSKSRSKWRERGGGGKREEDWALRKLMNLLLSIYLPPFQNKKILSYWSAIYFSISSWSGTKVFLTTFHLLFRLMPFFFLLKDSVNETLWTLAGVFSPLNFGVSSFFFALLGFWSATGAGMRRSASPA